LIVYELNRPGGDLGSVTDIMNDFNDSPIPVVVWVSPSGAAAWSGGTYILMASHIAAMASGTTIGSAQPVLSTGELLNESKYMNALSGLMRDNARLHNRNETVAEQFVRQNINIGPEEALRFHVIEFAEREKVGVEARNIIDEKTEHWGIKVSSVEVKDIAIPHALQEAMSRQAQAERERRARVTLAMAEFEAAQKMVDAANLYDKNIRALELRWMNILYELALQSKGTLMLVPTNTPIAGVSTGFPPLGIASIQDIAKEKKEQKTQ